MKKHIIPAILLGILGASSAQAATVFGELQSTAAPDASTPIDVVSNDLLQTAFGSVVGGPTTEAVLRDGLTAGSAKDGPHTGLWVDNGGALQTDYYFDVTTNFNGYDIEDIRVFTGWDSNRAQVGYNISYSLVGSADFTLLGTVESPADQGAANSNADWSFLTLTYDDADGIIAGLSGVDAIRFDWDFSDNDSDSSTRGAVFKEIDVIGTAVAVPEPSTSALVIGLMTLGLVATRRRK